MPYCVDSSGKFVNDLTLAVYRREYDGSFTEIASGIPNNRTAVTDPHPSLDYARYRLIAKDMYTGAISFFDMPGHKVDNAGVIIQWDEVWDPFDTTDVVEMDVPDWSGSMLILPYNIDTDDKRQTEVKLIEYAGRKHPVSYYGTQLGETSTWNVEIDREDTETIYALRRLSIWAGDAYVREPSGLNQLCLVHLWDYLLQDYISNLKLSLRAKTQIMKTRSLSNELYNFNRSDYLVLYIHRSFGCFMENS